MCVLCRCHSKASVSFPYAIVEIKLPHEDAEEPWLTQLQQSGLLVPAPKYGTALAILCIVP